MKCRRILWVAVGAAALAGCAGAGADPMPGFASDQSTESYSIGHAVGSQMRESLGEVDRGAFLEGLSDALEERSRLTPDQIAAALASRQERETQAYEAERLAEAEQNQSQGEAFRAAFAADPAVVSLENGLQYKVLVAGDGAIPEPDDRVTVHYRGRFVDGTEFDSSYARQAPEKVPVDRVIPGWSEALTRMPVGSTWEVVIPPSLAYGEAGAGGFIGPNSTLVFELELIGIG